MRTLINGLILISVLGALMNIGVMMSNDSKMPVYFKNIDDTPQNLHEQYVAFDDFNEVRNPYLSDIFQIKYLRFSVGDVLMVGGILSVFCLIAFTTILQLIFMIKGGSEKNCVAINDR